MPIPSTTPLNRTFARDDVYSLLRQWIIEGDLAPGEKLKDKELAAQLGVSRTPIREALRKLEDERLIETAANRWTRVSLISLEDMEHIYPIILSLESLALKLAFPNLNDQHIVKMKSINLEFKLRFADNNPRSILEAETEFHQVFIKAADNQELEQILEHLKIKYKRIELAFFSDASLFEDSFKDHNQLIEALEKKDLGAALQALANNWKVDSRILQRKKN